MVRYWLWLIFMCQQLEINTPIDVASVPIPFTFIQFWCAVTDVLSLSQIVLWDISAHVTHLQAGGNTVSDNTDKFVSIHVLSLFNGHSISTITHGLLYHHCWWITFAVSCQNSFVSGDVSMVFSRTCSWSVKACIIIVVKALLYRQPWWYVVSRILPPPHPFIKRECSDLMFIFQSAACLRTRSMNTAMPRVILNAPLFHQVSPPAP